MTLVYGKIRIKPQNLIYIILFFTLIMNTLCDDFGFSSNIRYINDIIIFLLLISIILEGNLQKYVIHLRMNKVFVAMFVYTFINVITIIINLVPLNLVVWAVRNTYRFFVFFWACIIYLKKKDLYKILDLMYKLQWINVILIIYQFGVLGLKQDYIGGIFGHGANAGLLIYSILLLTYTISKYIAGEYSLFKLIFVLSSTCIISVLAEIRIFLVLAFIVIIMNVWFNKGVFKKVGILLAGGILFFLAIDMYSKLFPYVSLSMQAFLNEGMSTGGGYNISRLGMFSEIKDIFFGNSVLKKIFGFGFGNCEYSNLSIFSSDFYDIYGDYNYRWFTSQWIFLETGYAGIISYISIFIFNIVYAIRAIKYKEGEREFYLICIILSIVCIISIFYNSLLKADFGYIAFFALSISGINYKEILLKARE